MAVIDSVGDKPIPNDGKKAGSGKRPPPMPVKESGKTKITKLYTVKGVFFTTYLYHILIRPGGHAGKVSEATQKATKSRGSVKPAQPPSQANVSGNEMEIDSVIEDQVMPASKGKHNCNLTNPQQWMILSYRSDNQPCCANH